MHIRFKTALKCLPQQEKENINIIITYQIVYIGVYIYIPHQIYRCISVWFIDFRAS
jgi:hypothetical protein